MYLRRNESFAGLAAAFGVGTATAHRYVSEVVELLAELAPDLLQALCEHSVPHRPVRRADLGVTGVAGCYPRPERSSHARHRWRAERVGGAIGTPYKCNKRRKLGKRKKLFNRHHAKVRALGERGAAPLKQWHIMRNARCSPSHLTASFSRSHPSPPGQLRMGSAH
ncbi:transposase family protein [Actinomadura fulvescens]|uniref:Transposase Helix-turn-helix domain-containing protein n=1 Tax=Actinomadura fulvescens TaxID=46160 RepID=A0ABN3PEP9_9ACTN